MIDSEMKQGCNYTMYKSPEQKIVSLTHSKKKCYEIKLRYRWTKK